MKRKDPNQHLPNNVPIAKNQFGANDSWRINEHHERLMGKVSPGRTSGPLFTYCDHCDALICFVFMLRRTSCRTEVGQRQGSQWSKVQWCDL
ncbi:hypothetical protein CDAR_404991 [Caerostris darwini]|uniref:Uncharacterized protein n=1 Tax=Caerostris darwini TaxID=1538125 RepID=A0AAV4U6X1_9ARAC|nr:hypothetical protein CDAR_404991 [Caerostris darwini]